MPEYKTTHLDQGVGKYFDATKRVSFVQGGGTVGFLLFPKNPIHVGISSKIGVGGVSLFTVYNYGDDYYYDYDYYENDFHNVFVATPQIDLEMNITGWFKLRLSGSYQFVVDNNDPFKYTVFEDGKLVNKEFNPENFSAPSISLGFVFGWFK
jgi:hypothetical protein